jgi:energy-coupling factor transporter ATP-binding protein EcfA2
MRIDGIHIKNFLSFDTLEWTNLNPHLNIIVGPNGSGKTNLIQTLRAVKDVVNPNPEPRKSLWSQSSYRGSSQVPIEIRLDIQFTEAWEKILLSTFLLAVLCNDSVIQNAINKLVSDGTSVSLDKETHQARLSALLQEQLMPKDNEKAHLLKQLEWLFAGSLVVVYKGVNTWTYWYESRSNAQSFRLNLDDFSFYDDSVIDRCLQILIAEQDQFTPDAQLLLSKISSTTPKPSLRVEYSPILLATHQAFQQLTGVTLESGRPYGASSVFHLLLERALVFSDNIRSQPQYKFFYDALHEQPIDLSSGEQLARYLFLKKNGSQTDREQYEAIWELFSKITGRSFDVGFDQPTIIPTRAETVEKSTVVLSIRVRSDWGDIPLAFSGAGRAEVLFICTLIAGRNEQIILLDEPALNMHVTMQKMILNELQAAHGNQYFLVTHSPILVPPESILKVSRFYLHQGYTCRATLSRGSLSTEEFSSLEKELRLSTDACHALQPGCHPCRRGDRTRGITCMV